MGILLREGPREVPNRAKLRHICPSTWSCPGHGQAAGLCRRLGLHISWGNTFSLSSNSVNECLNSLLHSWAMPFLLHVSASPAFKSILLLLLLKKKKVSEVKVGRRDRQMSRPESGRESLLVIQAEGLPYEQALV